jgi:hypothetical protein
VSTALTGGVRLARVQDDFARWVTVKDAPAATPGLVGDARASAAERLGVYRHAYLARLVAALGDDFPTLRLALGAAAFDALARDYVRVYPSRHPSLRFAGDRLAAFLASHADAAETRARMPWTADLAALEWAITDAFDAADAPALTRADLAALAPEAWAELALAPLPGAQLLAFAWPVRALREARDAEAALPFASLTPCAERVLVWRRDEQVLHRAVSEDEAALLALAMGGVRFGALCERAADARGDGDGAAFAASALARWVADGVLARSV